MPKCCICKSGVFKLKAPGLQCSGACREFYHFQKCANLTANEIELIENKRLTWQCKSCKRKRTSLVFSRTESVSENEQEINKDQQETIIKNQKIIMESIDSLKKLVDSCIIRINFNTSKIENLFSKEVNKKVVSNEATVVNNDISIIDNDSEDDSIDGDFQDARTVVTTAEIHGNYRDATHDTISNQNNIFETQHRRKQQTRHRDKISRLIVKPISLQTNEKTKTDLRNKVTASVPIRGVRNALNGGIIVTCDSFDEIKALQKQATDNLGAEYEVKLLEKQKPKILIVGMTTLHDKGVLSAKLKAQNNFLENSTISVLKVQQSTKSSYFNAVVELDNQSYKKALHFRKLLIDWDRCLVYDNVYVVQCYKCCGYNHKTNICKNNQACSKCAQQHLFKNCNSNFSLCINCKTANEKFHLNLDVNHPAWDKKCSVYLRKIQLEKRKINYDNN